MIKFLLDNGANINQPDKDNATPLYYASSVSVCFFFFKKENRLILSSFNFNLQHGKLAVVEFLSEQGADINLAMDDGTDSLWIASQVMNLILDFCFCFCC